MKKILLSVLAVLSFDVSLFAQQFKIVQVLQEQRVLLNSGASLGGRTRIAIPLTIPRNAVKIAYSITTSNNTNSQQTLSLFSQALRLYDVTGALSEISNTVLVPSGSAKCDVYFMSDNNCSKFINNVFNDFDYYRDVSRDNYVSGVVEFKASKKMQDYNFCLGLRNRSALYGILVNVEVIAVVVDE